MPRSSAAAGSGSSASTESMRRPWTHPIREASDGPAPASMNTCGDVAIASTPSRSRVSAALGPGRRSSPRSPEASISTSSPGERAGISGPLTSTPPDTARSVSVSERCETPTIASDPAPGSAVWTTPMSTTGRAPKLPLTVAGPGVTTASELRSRPNTTAPTTAAGSALRPLTAAANSPAPAAPTPSGSIDDSVIDPTNPAPHPTAKPPQIHVAARPVREAARSLTGWAGRRGGSAPGP